MGSNVDDGSLVRVACLSKPLTQMEKQPPTVSARSVVRTYEVTARSRA